jgi:hypothetical protein
MKSGVRYTGALVALVVCTGIVQAGEIGWPEAVARLTKERSSAEVYVASLKGRGNGEQVARGRLAYGAAKADLDAVIAGLMTALAEGGNPESLPSLEAELERGASALAAFCNCKTVSDLPLSTTEQKNWVGDAVKEAIEPLIKPLSEAVWTIYANFRNDRAETRMTIRTQLEATKWPEFEELKAAP